MEENRRYNPIYYTFLCLKKHKKVVPLMIIDAIFSALFIFVPSYIMKNIIYYVSKATSYEELLFHTKGYILFYFLFFFVSIIIFRLWDYFIDMKTFPQIKKEIILENLTCIFEQSKDYFQKNFSGEIAQKIEDLKDGVVELLKLFFAKLLNHILSILIACAGLLYYNRTCGLIIIGWIIFFLIIAKIYGKKISKVASEWANDSSLLNGVIVDILSNALAVKIFNNQKYEKKNIQKYAEVIQNKEVKIEQFFLYGWLLYSVSFFIIQMTSLYILYQQYKMGIINSSDFVFVWSINASVVNLLWRFLKDFVEYPKFYSEIKESLLILKKDIEIKNLSEERLIITEGKIEFRNVYFSFENQPIFKNLNLIIYPGQKIGLVGFSGTGKTTLINLLLRLYEIDSGEILIDNQNIKKVQLSSLYENINLVPQENILFHRSIIDNILYSSTEVDTTKDNLKKAISLAALDEFIDKLPQKENTPVGERGSFISGGQKQRISLARAYLKNSKILILDEATSNLDNITEKTIQENLDKIMKNKTTIIIAHRLSTIEKMDRIIVFDKYSIIEDGNHIELIQKNGLYKNLWQQQLHTIVE